MARDTAADSEQIGATEPWYGVLSAPEFLSANLTDEIKDKFYGHGVSDMSMIMSILEAKFSPFAPKTGADFGSGLGRLVFPMASVCDHVYGIDISPAMRAESAVQANARGLKNVEFVPVLPDGVTVDWINSYIVFQHILPRTGYELLRGLLSRLVVGGHVSIQLTFAHNRRGWEDIHRDLNVWRFDGETLTVLKEAEYATGRMSNYDYDMNGVLRIFTEAGMGDMHLRHTVHGGALGFWISGAKTFSSSADPRLVLFLLAILSNIKACSVLPLTGRLCPRPACEAAVISNSLQPCSRI